MIRKETREKMKTSSYLLPHPGGDIVRSLLMEIDKLENKINRAAYALKDGTGSTRKDVREFLLKDMS